MGFVCLVQLGSVYIFFIFIMLKYKVLASGNCGNIDKLQDISFSAFLKCDGKNNFYELTILTTKAFPSGGIPTKEFSIRIHFFPSDKPNWVFSSSNSFYQKLFSQILIHAEKSGEIIINVRCFMDVQYSFSDSIGYIKQ